MPFPLRQNWQPDPDAPFQPPKHLRDAIEEFESTEVPGIGLKPRPLPSGTGGATVTGGGAQSRRSSTEGPPASTLSGDVDFIYS